MAPPILLLSTFLFHILHFTAHISLAAAQSIRQPFYLPHYMCLPALYLPKVLFLSHTHTLCGAVVLRQLWHNPDSWCLWQGNVFCAELFPSKVQIFLALQLWSTRHGGLVSTVLCFSWRACRTPMVSLIALCLCRGSLTTMRCYYPLHPASLPPPHETPNIQGRHTKKAHTKRKPKTLASTGFTDRDLMSEKF